MIPVEHIIIPSHHRSQGSEYYSTAEHLAARKPSRPRNWKGFGGAVHLVPRPQRIIWQLRRAAAYAVVAGSSAGGAVPQLPLLSGWCQSSTTPVRSLLPMHSVLRADSSCPWKGTNGGTERKEQKEQDLNSGSEEAAPGLARGLQGGHSAGMAGPARLTERGTQLPSWYHDYIQIPRGWEGCAHKVSLSMLPNWEHSGGGSACRLHCFLFSCGTQHGH